MPDKGKIMSQTYYEKQSKLLKLYQEAIVRKEINIEEGVAALKTMGYSNTIAPMRIRDWLSQPVNIEQETGKTKKHRGSQIASLEKYMLRMRLGKKKYDEFRQLQSKKN
jgi:hypothetical protein